MVSVRKIFVVMVFSAGLTTMPLFADAQFVILDWIKKASAKVIKAIDLKVQRLQNRTIELQNIQKQIENTLSKLKLEEIANWTQRQKEIYEQYFDELWRVKSFIAYYRRITEIIDKQKQLINEYKRAFALLRNDEHFTEDEIEYIHSIYTGIIDKSIKSLDQILLLVQSFTLQISDAERLELLSRSIDEIEEYSTDLRSFTQQNIALSLQRAKNLEDVETIKKLYGIQ